MVNDSYGVFVVFFDVDLCNLLGVVAVGGMIASLSLCSLRGLAQIQARSFAGPFEIHVCR